MGGGILPHNSIPHSLPGATPEALPAEDNACVICREEMGPEVTALPCCHVFHTRFGAKQAVLGSLLGVIGTGGIMDSVCFPPIAACGRGSGSSGRVPCVGCPSNACSTPS